jgi:ankyrin repeat protein
MTCNSLSLLEGPQTPGSGLTAAEKDGWTALHVAAQNGNESVVKLLVERGADVKGISKDGWTAIHMAAQNGHDPVEY